MQKERDTSKPKFEIFYDESYYGMWAVRQIGDTSFESGWSFMHKSDAEEFKRLLEIAK